MAALRPLRMGHRAFNVAPRALLAPRAFSTSLTARAEQTLRRFWKSSNITSLPSGSYQITLDHRALKTPSGSKLEIPKERRLLAAMISGEWENQDEVLKQHALPVTSLASRAIDGLSDPFTRPLVIDALLKYLQTDTILFPDEAPPPLVRLQKEHWDPLHAWLKEEFGVTLALAEGFGGVSQSEETIGKLRKAVEEMDAWELAAFERAVYATKSFVISLALLRGHLTAHEAADASHVEVRSQIERWGEVEDTHDVDYQDIRRALGSVAVLLAKSQ
ncbi:ATP synthase mitochondrial F1 complex assembly factor 2 [Cryptococcus wingfieldii CBS 7118]|uniref:ATP synthase mitochondrial F1 complex assembly factor 2 n=1 Tax=Cryptococcus wingfieldii CBS 7118 TaxID=1295528 RepID=A0A1E3JI10_9TREE|nr:ATP synthase mitochondrial F1 complex assembly factor 2 [Cryptococcus wingfieldii CBS 7118]ODN99551.1 ATP synthase mitochondrial F1 complex assembly factor 2 [Cryptococcus wingfieldii CBS 7118]